MGLFYDLVEVFVFMVFVFVFFFFLSSLIPLHEGRYFPEPKALVSCWEDLGPFCSLLLKVVLLPWVSAFLSGK